jgi:hypothetical protein
VAFVGCVDCLVANNTIIDPEDWHLRILQETVSLPPYAFLPCGDSAFVNNLVYFDRSRLKGTDVNVGANTEPGTFRFANNLWYAWSNPGDSQADLPTSEVDGLIGQDPQLADPDATNCAITIASPAAQAGTASGATHPDFKGAPLLRPPSAGAHEVTGDLDADGLADVWELRHFGRTNATDGGLAQDADGDRFRDAWEYTAGTDPTNAKSLLALSGTTGRGGLDLRWPSVEGRTYAVYETTSLAGTEGFARVSGDLPATPATNTYALPRVAAPFQAFYRVGVHGPQDL